MTAIKNDCDYRRGYEFLSILTELDRKTRCDDSAKLDRAIVEAKRELRRYANREINFDRRIVKDYGMDGFVSLERLPDDIRDEDEANRFFAEFMTCHYYPSMYDCTGQAFTNWFKVFKRHGHFYAYHSVAFDV